MNIISPPPPLHTTPLNTLITRTFTICQTPHSRGRTLSFQNSKKQMSVIKLPEVLCVHLKGFRLDAYFSTKISRHISFPLTDLDISDYLRDERAHKERYSLDAVITHIGGAGGGHYIAYVLAMD